MSTTTKKQIWPQNQKLHECLDSKPPTEEHKRQERKRKERKLEQLRFKLLLRPSSNLNLVLKHYLTSAVFLETFDVELTDGHMLPWCRQQGLQDAASRGEHHLMPSSELVIRFFGFH